VSRRRVVPIAIAAIILLLATVVAIRDLPIRHVERSRLARLAVTAPPPGFKAKPSVAIVAASSNPFSGVAAATKRSPNATGSYSVEWSGTSSSNDAASFLVSLLPSASQARVVQSEAIKANLGGDSYTEETYANKVTFPVAEIPGAEAATYSATSSHNAPILAVLVERVDRVVILELVRETGDASKVQATTLSVAESEYQHLRRTVAGFSLVRTHWPLLAISVDGAVGVLLALLAIATPPVVGRARRRRRVAQQEAARRLVLQRGGKVAKRQAHHRR